MRAEGPVGLAAEEREDMDIKEVIKEYQCSGCVCGSNTECGNYKKSNTGSGCDGHYPGTMDGHMRKIYLGMPKGFWHYGPCTEMYLIIFETQSQQQKQFSYDWLNIPCWKHQNKEGHIFIRGLSPRINMPFLHIILDGDFQSYGCLEVTKEMLAEID